MNLPVISHSLSTPSSSPSANPASLTLSPLPEVAREHEEIAEIVASRSDTASTSPEQPADPTIDPAAPLHIPMTGGEAESEPPTTPDTLRRTSITRWQTAEKRDKAMADRLRERLALQNDDSVRGAIDLFRQLANHPSPSPPLPKTTAGIRLALAKSRLEQRRVSAPNSAGRISPEGLQPSTPTSPRRRRAHSDEFLDSPLSRAFSRDTTEDDALVIGGEGTDL